MTDNEKRAHDLALVCCAESAKLKINQQMISKSDAVNVDFFAEYMSAYELALDAFNERFPAGK